MARFHGKVGYGTSVEEPSGSGNWVDRVFEFPYSGNVLRESKREEGSSHLNQDISVGSRVSILADQYAVDNFHKIKYVCWMGALWTVTSVEYKRPRLILSLGSIYNGPTP